MPGGAVEVIRDELNRLTRSRTARWSSAFLIGLSLWSANGGLKALFDALNVLYESCCGFFGVFSMIDDRILANSAAVTLSSSRLRRWRRFMACPCFRLSSLFRQLDHTLSCRAD